MIHFIGNWNKLEENDGTINQLDIDKAVEEISKHAIICEDTETKSLDYTLKNQVKLIQIGTLTDQYVFDVATCDYLKLKPILENKKITKINANGIFERTMLTSIGIRITSMFDLLLAARVLRQGKKDMMVDTAYGQVYIYSLAGLYKGILGIDLEKDVRKEFLKNKDTYTLREIKYAAKDVMLFDLYNEVLRKLLKYNLIKENTELWKTVDESLRDNQFSVAYLEFKAQEYFADMVYNGIKISKSKLLELYNHNIKERREIEKTLNIDAISKYPERFKGYYIEPFTLDNTEQLSLFGDDISYRKKMKKSQRRRINWNSHKQVADILFSEIGHPVTDKHGKVTTRIKELDKPKYTKFPLIKKFIDFKRLSKLIDAYGEGYLKYVRPTTNRIHTEVKQIKETGRISTNNPNMQQIPRGKMWRAMFEAAEGYDMVGADYSAQESQVMADKSQDSNFIDFFLNGDGDSHSMVASRVYTAKEKRIIKVSKKKLKIEKAGELNDVIVEKFKSSYSGANKIYSEGDYLIFENDEKDGYECELRMKGKILNFFISFGGSEYTLSQEQDMPIKEAKELIDGFWEGFPELFEYFKKEKEKALSQGYITINEISGRRRWLQEYKNYRIIENKKAAILKSLMETYPKQKAKDIYYKSLRDRNSELGSLNSQSYKLKGDMERLAMNSGIQGTAADMTKTAAVLLMERIESEGLSSISDIKPVNTVHDEFLLESKKTYSEKAATMLKESMEKSSRIYNKTLTIKASPYIDSVWKH